MVRILKAIGYGMLAIAITILVFIGSSALAVIGAAVSMMGLGLAVVASVAFLLQDYAEHRKRQKPPP